MIEDLKTLISFESVTFSPACQDALDYMLDKCSSFGFVTKKGQGYGYGEIGQGEELMLIMGHLDVVPAGSGWQTNPFEAVIKDDGDIYGRGVMDDKGPMMAALYAMKDIYDAKIPLNKRVRILFGTAEELGDWDDIKAYKENEEWPTFGFTPDADFPLIYGEKGILQIELTMPIEDSGFLSVEGGDAPNMVADWAKGQLEDGQTIRTVGKSAHGSLPEMGENAISKLMAQAPNTTIGKWYNQYIHTQTQGQDLGIFYEDEHSTPLSLNVGQIFVRDNQLVITMDIRYPVTHDYKEIISQMEKVLLPQMQITIESHKEPIFMDKDGEVITKLMEAYYEVTKDPSEPKVIGGGTYARSMPNIVAFGPVFEGVELSEHQPNEHIPVRDLERARLIYKKAILKLASQQ